MSARVPFSDRDMDYDKLDAGTVETLEHIKGLMDEQWEPLSREMGLKADSSNFGKDNPLIAMRDNMENLVAGGVFKLLTEYPERAADILAHFADDPNIEQNADAFLHNAVETTMLTMSYAETAEIVQEMPAYEDFDHSQLQNYRGMDFDRKWNHSRAKAKTESLDALQEADDEGTYPVPDFFADVEGEALGTKEGVPILSGLSEGFITDSAASPQSSDRFYRYKDRLESDYAVYLVTGEYPEGYAPHIRKVFTEVSSQLTELKAKETEVEALPASSEKEQTLDELRMMEITLMRAANAIYEKEYAGE